MADQLFREKSLERVSSPEEMNDYIRVTTPSIWIILLAAVILMLGILVWAVFGRIDVHDQNGEKVSVAPITYVTN